MYLYVKVGMGGVCFTMHYNARRYNTNMFMVDMSIKESYEFLFK